jgi:methylated-DNA-[protein]-cysteine S-methyltransferase
MTPSTNHQHMDLAGSIGAAIADADDPCEVVEDAIPALVIGDLTSADERAIASHCQACSSCAAMLTTCETCFDVLEPPEECAQRGVPDCAAALGLRRGQYGMMESPVGDLMIVVTEDGVADIGYLVNHSRDDIFAELEERGILATQGSGSTEPVRDQLREYFAQQRTDFTLPVDLFGVTSFTREVLRATTHVPFGEVRTYQGIANAIGRPSASRAVGNALGRNPVPVIVPCHRVVRSDGSMGWYTGGAHIKERLLDIEGVRFAAVSQAQPSLPGLQP